MTGKVSTFWTTLPNGEVSQRLRASIFVTPKLLGAMGQQLTLDDFPVAADWANVVKNIQFKLFLKSEGRVFAVGDGRLYSPTNRGETGLNDSLWSEIFHPSATLVVPEQISQDDDTFRHNTDATEAAVGVHYRTLVIDKLVSESRLFHSRQALLVPGESPQPSYVSADEGDRKVLQSTDRFVQIASGTSGEFTLKDATFPAKSGELYSFESADTVTQQFDLESDSEIVLSRRRAFSINSGILNNELSDEDIVNNYEVFSLYHRHGVRNRNYQIRSTEPEAGGSPEFNFVGAETFEIEDADNGKLLEFAEPVPLLLPEISTVRDGFEISVFYNPSEDDDSSNQENGNATSEKYRESFTGLLRPLRIQTTGGDIFQNGVSAQSLRPFRGQVISKSSVGNWSARPIEQKDFHEIISGLGSYPILLRKLGLIFDLEFPREDLPIEETEFSILAEPVFAQDNLDDLSIYPFWSRVKRADLIAQLDNGTELASFSMLPKDSKGSIGGLKVLNPLKGSSVVGFNTYDLDATAHKVFQKAIADGAPPFDPEVDPYHQSNAYSVDDRIGIPGSPSSVAKELGSQEGWPRLEEDFRQPAARSTGISMYVDLDGVKAVKQFNAERTDFRIQLRSQSPDVFWPRVEETDTELYEEDVTVGYKVDVFVEDDAFQSSEFSHWYSLCSRQLSFNFGSGSTLGNYLAPADEFWVEAAASQEIDEGGRTQLRVSDNLFRWDGWSLVAPHPGDVAPETGTDVDPDWQRSIDLTVYTEAEAISLAKLRYGRSYKFRNRLADLAGNAVHFEYANAYLDDPNTWNDVLFSSEKITYRRHDPVSPPVLYSLQSPGPGNKSSKIKADSSGPKSKVGPDSADILVIRSGEDIPASLSTARWLVLPPDTDFQEAEWAGMFDSFRSPDEAYDVMARYTGNLPEKYEGTFVRSITWPSGQIGTPYLPDGYAAEAAFCFLPNFERNSSAQPTSFSERIDLAVTAHFGVSFNLAKGLTDNRRPFSQSFFLKFQNSEERSTVLRSGVLEVGLPPGEQQLVMLSSAPAEERLDDFALFHEAFNNEQFAIAQTELNQAALTGKSLSNNKVSIAKTVSMGLNWPISPAKPVRLIHAVPKPILRPEFSNNLQITNRVTGGNAVVMEDSALSLHRVSTGKVDIYAEWDEYIDTPGDPQCPRIQRERRHCFKCDIPLPDLTIKPDQTHYEMDIGSRHTFPNNKHLSVRYIAVATTRYLEYFDEELTQDQERITIESEPSCEIDIFNTSPPPPPEVAYILPLFIWEKEELETVDTKRERVRRRTGFRIYLKRGWFKSGKGEKLAVLLQSDAVRAKNSGDLTKSPMPLTHWGSDPTIYEREPITRQLVLTDFIGDVERIKACEIAEEYDVANPPRPAPVITDCSGNTVDCIISSRDGIDLPAPVIPALVEGQRSTRSEQKQKSRAADQQGPDLLPSNEIAMDVAAYEVKCDLGKDLLYVDVEIENPKAYMPFVKFALARYQASSAKYCHLSSAVEADFVQLSPERTLSIAPISSQPQDISIVISGSGPGFNERGYQTNVMRVFEVGDGQKFGQIPLEVYAAWDESERLLRWEFILNKESGRHFLVQEIELVGVRGSDRMVSSFEFAI